MKTTDIDRQVKAIRFQTQCRSVGDVADEEVDLEVGWRVSIGLGYRRWRKIDCRHRVAPGTHETRLGPFTAAKLYAPQTRRQLIN